MGEVLTRKCACCKGVIEIDVDYVHDVVYFDKLYYHKSCFEELAAKRMANKRSSPKWQAAMSDNLRQVQKDADYEINYCYGRDMLYNHILANYDVYSVSSYANMTFRNIVEGNYKGKSRPIPYREFAECWIDNQTELDRICSNNLRLGKRMAGDQRINYDTAVVVRMYPEWRQHKIKAEREQKEFINSVVFDEIDMSRIGHKQHTQRRDMSDISDDLFVE